jgi:hypothetical protein
MVDCLWSYVFVFVFHARGSEVASVWILQVPERTPFLLDPVVASAIRHLLEEK